MRLTRPVFWRALAKVFPIQSHGPTARLALMEGLKFVEARGNIELPPGGCNRWDRAHEPAIPTTVDAVRHRRVELFDWKAFRWHPRLYWVRDCPKLSQQQVEFLRRVHTGLFEGAFHELAPLKYRSLQLTGDENMLTAFTATSLFRPMRLELGTLGILPDPPPLAHHRLGDGGRMLLFQATGALVAARIVLAAMSARPYDLVSLGDGRRVLESIASVVDFAQPVTSIHYVGNLDCAGLSIARDLRRRVTDLGLPSVQPATELHRQMISAAEALGHGVGWPAEEEVAPADRLPALEVLDPAVRSSVEILLRAGRRIPEQVLGPAELRSAWGASASRK